MTTYNYSFKELPLSQIQRDPDQPRKDFGVEGEENRLLLSIKQYGMQEPISVTELENNRYMIIDGHRRYICVQKMQVATIYCRVYPKLSTGELESLRYESQNNRRSWQPLERSNAIDRIKRTMHFKTNEELAKHLCISETIIANTLQLRRQKMEYIALMEKYNLGESYRVEFLHIKPKIRKIRNFEVDDIINKIFEKIHNNVIKKARELHKLGEIFLKASANEEEIFLFLSNSDITISELEYKTLQSGFSSIVEELIQNIGKKQQEGIHFTEQEKLYLTQLKDLLNKTV